MKKILLFLLLPFAAFGQKNKKIKFENKFIIHGQVIGYANGTKVALIDPLSGGKVMVETTIRNNKFVLQGKVAHPEYRLLQFNNNSSQSVQLFLDNSNITAIGIKDSISKLIITGSPIHAEMKKLYTQLEPYNNVFSENVAYDSVACANAGKICSNYAISNPTSYVAPLALLAYTQVPNQDFSKFESWYNALSGSVKSTLLGEYIKDIVVQLKVNPVGSILPEFSQTDTSGNAINLSSLKGKYVLIDFWASWCKPCRQENPSIVSTFNKFKDKNFTVLGVSLDKIKRAWTDAIKTDSLTWTHVSDLKGWENAVALQYKVSNIPQNFLIDPQGKIIAKNLKGPSLEKVLTKILN